MQHQLLSTYFPYLVSTGKLLMFSFGNIQTLCEPTTHSERNHHMHFFRLGEGFISQGTTRTIVG